MQHRNGGGSAPASSALTLVLHRSHNAKLQIVTYTTVKKGASIGAAAVAKRQVLGQSNIETVKKSSL